MGGFYSPKIRRRKEPFFFELEKMVQKKNLPKGGRIACRYRYSEIIGSDSERRYIFSKEDPAVVPLSGEHTASLRGGK